MFHLKNFVKEGLMAAVGRVPDHQVILIAAYWFHKHVLKESDMVEIVAAMNPDKVVTDKKSSSDELVADLICGEYAYEWGMPDGGDFFAW